MQCDMKPTSWFFKLQEQPIDIHQDLKFDRSCRETSAMGHVYACWTITPGEASAVGKDTHETGGCVYNVLGQICKEAEKVWAEQRFDGVHGNRLRLLQKQSFSISDMAPTASTKLCRSHRPGTIESRAEADQFE